MLAKAKYAAKIVMIGGSNACAFQSEGLLDISEMQSFDIAVRAASECESTLTSKE